MRKLLAILAGLLIGANAIAAPAYVTFDSKTGTLPQTIGPLTPGTGNQVYILAATNSTPSGTFTITGTATTLTNISVVGASPCTGGCLNFTDGTGNDTYSLWGALSAAAGSQSWTITQPSGDSLMVTYRLEFSGGVSTKSPTYKTTASPGVGAGGVVGTAVTVASGDILAVVVHNSDIFGSAATVNLAGSNAITSIGATTAVYWTGTGASLTPTFTAAAGEGGSPHQVIQWVISATSSGGSCTHSGYTSGGAIATPNGTTGNYVGKSGAFVTPDCSTINYWQPTVGNFGAT